MKTPRILVFGGSMRAASFNQALAALAAKEASELGAEVTLSSLADFPLPVFNQDDEEKSGKPEKAKELKALFAAHDAYVIASPEYNSAISGALKNALDWISRADEEAEGPAAIFKGKTAAILAASPSHYGGVRGLDSLRLILQNIGTQVIPAQVTVAESHLAFDENGALKDDALTQQIRGLVQSLIESSK
ncbi:NAD(P)H-dependent oxidoreductase [Luteolibacter pohnpeiensis]|uniref:NAD(P)H-dependent oxidoreductase n=1 Tax=Luteolibacter pohnpeiensis TaxID=454153 RepID=A0A934VSW7_9BACT|nr:NAD(P)H-dependent oxidoreductase [Luteolibacter pohnpeiensis]MBK1880867.1 NAD(P)H-dependent oxidoreductase [Luteolibacter pohnpeiensis]